MNALKELVDRNEAQTRVIFPISYVFHIGLTGYSDRLWEVSDVEEILLRNGDVPAVADIAIAGILENRVTIVEILPSSRNWVREPVETWGGIKTGPFKAMNWYLQFLPPTFKSGMSIPGLAEFVLNGSQIAKRYASPR